MRYSIILTPEPDGSAVNVSVPAMPGVHTWGATEEEAIASAREAIGLHLAGYADRGRPAPKDRRPRLGRRATAAAATLRGRPVPTVATVEVGQLVGA